MWESLIDSLSIYGVGALVAGVLLWILYRVLSNFMNSLKEDRDNYMLIIKKQNETQNNHIRHLDNAVQSQSHIISSQSERFAIGIEKVCDTLESQTEILKTHMSNRKFDG